MCGIFGGILRKGSVASLIHQGLKRLEYRGYDSAGIATVEKGTIQVKKESGTIDAIHEKLNLDDMLGSTGVGHTRWATHGAPMQSNAHPHTDCKTQVAAVHNGVIENFMELKLELEERGHRFVSRTDTEVIPHLIEEGMEMGDDLYGAVVKAVNRVEGSYAVAVISSLNPDRIVCARKESPLVLGVSKEGVFCASDMAALLPYTNKMITLQNGEMAVLTPKEYTITRISDGTVVEREAIEVDWTVEMAEKQGYPHFMLKEIHQQPQCLTNTLRLQDKYVQLLATLLDRGQQIFLTAAGTSYHACIAASYMFSKLARLTTYPAVASEFVESWGSSVSVDTVIMAVSQSGETYDVLRAVDYARMRAATTLGVTNTVGSTLTRVVRAYIVQQSGPEIGVAATKTFTSQLMVLAQLALRLGRIRGKISQDEADELQARLKETPYVMEKILTDTEAHVKRLAHQYSDEKLFLFLGRGVSTATAFEGRLKLLEITYIPSLAFPAGESKHGPISVIEENVPVLFICPRDETKRDVLANIMEMKARGARILAICEEGDTKIMDLADDCIQMPPGIPELLSPVFYAVPLQLFAYYLAVERGLNPDKPRNLAKSVTVP